MNITFAQLEQQFGADAEKIYAEVCQVGGFGTVPQAHEGGLDLSGCPADIRKKIDAIIQPKSKKGDNE